MDTFVPLIEHTRAGLLECRHLGAVALVNTQGKLLAQAGDPYWNGFTRSTLKALQALAFMQGGGDAQFGFDSRDLAMMCASHSGEAKHVQQVDRMLAKTGLDRQRLLCGCHVPYFYDNASQERPAAPKFDERHNNCSGKHAGFLAYCVQHGHAIGSYIDPGHPLQQAVRQAVAQAVDLQAQDLAIGIDGCSAPNFAMPLANLALGYARLASGARDSRFGASFALLAQAMTDHPDLVSGSGRNDLALMLAGRGDWVTKTGADGLQGVGSKSRGEAFAIKVIGADKPALYAATVEVLRQLGWLDATQAAELSPWSVGPICNARGLQVGARRAVFSLRGAAA
jgi:L-asparaginase II